MGRNNYSPIDAELIGQRIRRQQMRYRRDLARANNRTDILVGVEPKRGLADNQSNASPENEEGGLPTPLELRSEPGDEYPEP